MDRVLKSQNCTPAKVRESYRVLDDGRIVVRDAEVQRLIAELRAERAAPTFSAEAFSSALVEAR